MQTNKFHLLTLICALMVTSYARSTQAEEVRICVHEATCSDEQEQLASLEKTLLSFLSDEEGAELQKRFKEMDVELKAKKSPSTLFTLGEYSACLLLVYVYFTQVQPWLKAKYNSDAAAELGKLIVLAPFANVIKNTSEYWYNKAKASVAEVV